MKKILIIILAALAFFSPVAAKKHKLLTRQQDTIFYKSPDLAWSIEFGYTQPWLRQDNRSMMYMHGGHIGAMVDWRVPHAGDLTLHSGLRLTQSFGAHTEQGVHNAPIGDFQQEYVKNSIAMTTLSIPLHLRYDFRIYKDWHIFVFGGPTFECGLAMRNKVDNQLTYGSVYDPESDETNNTMASYASTFPDAWSTLSTGNHGMYGEKKVNPFSMQMTVGGGFRYKHWSIQGGYDFGLNNQSRLSNKKTNPLHKWQWFAGFSYIF